MEIKIKPAKYLGNGNWLFKKTLKGANYSLEIRPHLFLYTLRRPDGTEQTGTTMSLLNWLDSDHLQPELAEWISEVLEFKSSDVGGTKFHRQTFYVDDISYHYQRNIETDEITILLPTRAFIGTLDSIEKEIPEIRKMHFGAIWQSILTGIKTIEDKTSLLPNIQCETICFNKVLEFSVDNRTILFSYHPSTKLIYLHVGNYAIRTHPETYAFDLAPFFDIQNGKFYFAAEKQIQEHDY